MKLNLILNILYITLIFFVGFLVGQVWDSVFYGGVTGLVVDTPSNFISEEGIEVFSDKVIIEVDDAKLSSYGPSGSMLPTLGEGMTGISIVPNSADEIEVGDIVIFKSGNELIVHRVVEKGVDSDGLYFITKGDNSLADDGKIRFEEIERVLIGLVF